MHDALEHLLVMNTSAMTPLSLLATILALDWDVPLTAIHMKFTENEYLLGWHPW
jgi:hypothetical protein